MIKPFKANFFFFFSHFFVYFNDKAFFYRYFRCWSVSLSFIFDRIIEIFDLIKAWSITYHSLFTLVYLLFGCFIWVLPDSRQRCLQLSPFLMIYGSILLLIEYSFGFSISFDRYHFLYDRKTMEQIGIRVSDYQPAFPRLILQVEFRSNSKFFLILFVFLVVLLDFLLFNIETIDRRETFNNVTVESGSSIRFSR